MSMIESYGAAKTVTGSAHLLRLDSGQTLMIDCGMFQGENENKNYLPFDFDPSEIDFLLFTHAHLDHVGRAPLLYKYGFRGEIITTRATLDLAEIVMLDSAHLMQEVHHTTFKKAQRQGKEKKVKPALYTAVNVTSLLNLKKKYVQYGESLCLAKDLHITFYNAGHILGSAFIEITYVDNKKEKTLVFSGDLGNKNDFVLPFPMQAKVANDLYIESTYGDREHKGIKPSIKEFKKVVLKTLKKGGNVLIPSFAIERTQEILCLLKQMYKSGELPKCSIFLDSPMAIRATRVYNKHANELSLMCQEYEKEDGSIFDFEFLEFSKTPMASKKINEIKSGAIIISGSGMCNGGRILHHFKHRLWNKRNAVVFVGYQAKGTLGRKIVEGAKWVEIYNEKIKIKASIHTINGFSAHADQAELIKWMEGFEKLGHIYLIHGEEDKQKLFKKAIKQKLSKKSHIVKFKEEIYI